MKLSNSVTQCWMMGTRIAKILCALVAIVLTWQSPFFLNSTAMAAPSTLIATTGADQVKGAADDVRDRSKDLIQDTKQGVEKLANKNAAKVDESEDKGGFFSRKARRDQARIYQRAEDHAARTEKAVDNSMDAVKGTAETIKDAFRS